MKAIQTWIIYREALLWKAEHQSGQKHLKYVWTHSRSLMYLLHELLTALPTSPSPATLQCSSATCTNTKWHSQVSTTSGLTDFTTRPRTIRSGSQLCLQCPTLSLKPSKLGPHWPFFHWWPQGSVPAVPSIKHILPPGFKCLLSAPPPSPALIPKVVPTIFSIPHPVLIPLYNHNLKLCLFFFFNF